MPITVLLAGDKDVERQAIRRILQAHPEIELVGEATNFPQATQMSNDLKPQVIISDLHMPDDALVSPEEVRTLLNSGASRLVVISIWKDEEANVLANKFGAYTLLDKNNLAGTLVPAILEKAAELRSQSAGNS
jgi:two-component system nitrate/nitrite response regulator NarL